MSQVRIGSVTIGTILHNPIGKGMWTSSRATGDGFIIVGSAGTRDGALTLLGRSLIAKSMEEGRLSATQQLKLRDLLAQLDALGLGTISKAIQDVLR